MENQHRKIAGYRELNEEEINAINAIKREGTVLEQLIIAVQTNPDTNANERWLAIARTHFQEGLMALTRAVAKPLSF